MYNKTQGLYRVPAQFEEYFKENYLNKFIEAVEYSYDGEICIKSKEFDSIYKKEIKKFTDWISTNEALTLFNNASKNELWLKYCSGTVAKWEMDSIGYYTKIHELEENNINDYYTLVDFNELPTEPEIIYKVNEKNGREFKQMKLFTIAGVVVDKNKTKKIVTLSTTFGVVEVKLYRESFAFYDKKTETEDGWFKRGTKLLITGFRRGESFIPRTYFDSTFRDSIYKINYINGKILLREKSN